MINGPQKAITSLLLQVIKMFARSLLAVCQIQQIKIFKFKNVVVERTKPGHIYKLVSTIFYCNRHRMLDTLKLPKDS